jgi:hypothetical protein
MEPFTHAELTRSLIKLGPNLMQAVGGQGSMADRLNRLMVLVLDDLSPDYAVDDGRLLRDALVENAVALLPGYGYDSERADDETSYLPPRAAAFLSALELNGFTVSGGELRRALPVDVALPTAQSEVDRLLEKHKLTTPRAT